MRMLDLSNPNLDLDLEDMNQKELIDLVMHLLKRNAELEKFQEGAFMVSPNIDLDIEFMRRRNNGN
jgi:hypothetical protein